MNNELKMIVISIVIVVGVISVALFSSFEMTFLSGLIGMVAINEMKISLGAIKHEA